MKISEVSIHIKSADPNQAPFELKVPQGANLRKALLEAKLTPYLGNKKYFNCRGMGLCGTCKVFVWERNEWWERRSCQIQCFQTLEIQLK